MDSDGRAGEETEDEGYSEIARLDTTFRRLVTPAAERFWRAASLRSIVTVTLFGRGRRLGSVYCLGIEPFCSM